MSLVAHYQMNEGTGVVSSPASGGWGDITSIPGWGAHAGFGACVTVNGVGADVPGVPDATTYSIALWVNATATGSFASILQCGGFYLEHNETRVLDVWLGLRGINGQTLTDGWHHIAVTSDGTTVTLYQDGVAMGTAATANRPAGTYKLGGSSDQPGNMSVDDLRFYDHALTPAEVAAIMQPPDDPDPPASTGIRGADGQALTAQLLTPTGLVVLTPRPKA